MSATVHDVPPVELITGAHIRTASARTPGMLWEREAERSERHFRHIWRGDMPRGPRVCETSGAWILGRHVCPRRASNGIIRAGERIK